MNVHSKYDPLTGRLSALPCRSVCVQSSGRSVGGFPFLGSRVLTLREMPVTLCQVHTATPARQQCVGSPLGTRMPNERVGEIKSRQRLTLRPWCQVSVKTHPEAARTVPPVA
jgi:hypothetical protein